MVYGQKATHETSLCSCSPMAARVILSHRRHRFVCSRRVLHHLIRTDDATYLSDGQRRDMVHILRTCQDSAIQRTAHRRSRRMASHQIPLPPPQNHPLTPTKNHPPKRAPNNSYSIRLYPLFSKFLLEEVRLFDENINRGR